MSSDTEKKEQEYGSKFISKLVTSIVILPIIMWIWPWAVPFHFFEFWKIEGSVKEWLYASWPIFLWGTSVSFLVAISSRNDRNTNRHAENIIIDGTLVSLLAGFFEEITFRWLFFLNAIVSVKLANFFFFGFLGFGLAEWFHMNVFGLIASFVTFHSLDSYLFHSTGWAVGAAMLAANAFFRDGHRYQGLLGVVNSWVIGMFLFWIMFKYGLPAAILIHFTYDFLIYLVKYLDAVFERARGYA